jgi:hypothetical protein
MLPSLAIKERQIRTALRLYLTLVRIATTIKNKMTTNVGEDVGQKEPLNTAGGNVS